MSKLGFDKALRDLKKIESRFLRMGMTAARREFRRNFDTESDAETGRAWDMVLRGWPPPILDVTGELRAQALYRGNIRFLPGSAILTVDPIDDRGRGYAQYHQDGIGRVHERAFLTQSKHLTNVQEQILYDSVNKYI